VKDNYENNSLQVELFENLRHILEVRAATILETGDEDMIGYEKKNDGENQVFVVRE